MWTKVVMATGLILAAGLPGNCLPAEMIEGQPAGWLTDYNLARSEATRLGLPMLVHFHASWCGPCQKMEHETLSTQPLVKQLGVRIIGVKIDSDEFPTLVEAFRVDSLPSDIVVAPDGRIVARTAGYQQRAAYIANLNHWAGHFERERADAIARSQATSPQTPMPSVAPQSPIPATQPLSQSQPQVAQATAQQPPEPSKDTPEATAAEPPPLTPLVGLDGFSPVRIKTVRQWVKGLKEFAVTYQGVVYYLADENEHRLFEANPERYTPRMLGCDPVELLHSDRALQGRVEYGAFFDGELFLFVSADSRNRFKIEPQRYTKMRHVLKSDEIVGTRLR